MKQTTKALSKYVLNWKVHYLMKLNSNYFFFLCLFNLRLFLRLWVATLCLFLFFPLGITQLFYFNF